LPTGKNIESNLISLFDDIRNVKDIKIAIRNLFSDYQKLIANVEEYFESLYKIDVKSALEINRKYYNSVLSLKEKYESIVENNLSSLRDAIRLNDDKLIKIENHSDELKFESEIIVNNKEIDVKKEIIDERKKLGKLIKASAVEIDQIKKNYLKNADKHLVNKQNELEQLAKEYQEKLEELRQKMRDRNQIYEIQVSKNRQIREQHVQNHSEKYSEIKNLHTSFSIHYNNRIHELSKIYRDEVKLLNDEYSEKINLLNEEINLHERNVLTKEVDTKTKIQEKSDSLKAPYQQAKVKYDHDLRFLVDTYNQNIEKLEKELKDFEDDINHKIKRYNEDYELGEKTKQSKKMLQNLVKPLIQSFEDEKKVVKSKKIRLIKEHRESIKSLYDEFKLNQLKLDREFISYEYEALLDNAKYFEKCILKINLLNLKIEKLEEEKNQKIWLLNNAYNQEITYFEQILALGSQRQEMMIQDQVGNNSFALASSQFNIEIVKGSFEVDSEQSNMEIKILKLVYLNNVKKVTAKYQLLIQEEMIKRDTLIKQYEVEILMGKETLKLVELKSALEQDLLRLKNEYELQLKLMENEQKSEKLNYFLNLTKIKLDDINKKHQATLEFNVAEAKASRNMDMYKLEAEKVDRYYLSLFETLITHHEKIDGVVSILQYSYSHPEFSMTKFYHLIDLINEVLPLLKEESGLLISYFKQLTDGVITQKIDELSGFHYRNKLQTILDQNASTDEVIKQDIEQINEDRSNLTSELVTLEQTSHRYNIQISQLYRDIQSLKSNSNGIETKDQLIKLKAELENINNLLKQNDKVIKFLQKQITLKDHQISAQETRLKRLERSYNRQKKRLGSHVKREARIYYKEKKHNLNQFANLKKLIDNYLQEKIKNLSKIKRNLSKTVNAIEIFNNDNQKTRLKFMDSLFKLLDVFRKVNLNIYFSQENDQANISKSFDKSYNILVNNLNKNYRNNFLKEKRNNFDNKKSYEHELLKLKQKYDLDVLKTNKTFEARSNAINKQLTIYDEEFRNTFVYRRNYVRTLTLNQLELNKGLDFEIDELTKVYTDEFNTYNSRKMSLLRDLSQKQFRLFNSTIDRSEKYRENYLETKDHIVEGLRNHKKDNDHIIKTKAKEYRKYLLEKKHQERIEHVNYRKKLRAKNKKITQKYIANLKSIN